MEMNHMDITNATVSRWYVRCTTCLSIGAVETNPYGQRWTCGICAGTVEVMGKVVLDKLETEHTRSACDARCTHARGPLCVCHCGCVNHGTGRVVRVVVKHDVPTIEFQDAETAMKIATAYRDALAAVETALSATNRSSYFYGHYKVTMLLRKARDARKHETRMKRIAEANTVLIAYQERATQMQSQRDERDAYVPAPIVIAPTTVEITGNTYPVKDEIKKLGGKWDGLKKAWIVPVAVADQARALVAAAPPMKSLFKPVAAQDAIPF
jgi:hypothetical protein